MYTPKVREDLVQRLYPLCQKLGIPMTGFVNGALERAVLYAEECMARGERKFVLDMVGVPAPARNAALAGGPASAPEEGEKKAMAAAG